MERPAGVPGKVTRKELVRFVLFRRRLNGQRRAQKERHGEKILIVIDIYTNVTNVTEEYSNIRPSEVDYIKKNLSSQNASKQIVTFD